MLALYPTLFSAGQTQLIIHACIIEPTAHLFPDSLLEITLPWFFYVPTMHILSKKKSKKQLCASQKIKVTYIRSKGEHITHS